MASRNLTRSGPGNGVETIRPYDWPPFRRFVVKQPLMFGWLLRDWIAMPKVLVQGIADGDAAREPRPGFVPLKGLSAISDMLPPQAYAYPGWAEAYNKAIRQFRRREAFSAFWSGISKSELEARLETYALLTAALVQQASSSTPEQQEITG
jgi:hypothetical protein